MGYATQEIAVGSRTVIDVVLEEVAQQIDEVVVVGYGTQRKVDLAGSVATMNAREISTVPISNLSQALAGRIAGVSVRSSSGGKPGSGAEVVVGARGTWNSTGPLYVIDGAVRDAEDFNLLSSSDIEAFSVLKDASAAAIYGARAANGVFLVTTKKGKTGKPTITYSGSYTIGEPAYEPERESFEQRFWGNRAAVMEGRNVNGRDEIITMDGYQPRYTSVYTNGTDASDGYLSGVMSDEAYAYYTQPGHLYDRLKEVYRTPTTKEHSLNVSGGNESVKYFLGGNIHNETGMFKSVEYKKYTLRSNVEAAITKNLKASLAINLSSDLNTSALNEDGSAMNDQMTDVYYQLNRSSQLVPGMVNGKYIVTDPNNTNGNSTSYSALADGAAGIFEKEKQNTEYTAGLAWEVPWVKGLTARVMYNRHVRQYHGHAKPKQYEVYALLRGNNPETEFAKNGGVDPNGTIIVPELSDKHSTRGNMVAWQEEQEWKTYQANAQISYSNTFGRHAVEGLLVYEQSESSNKKMVGKRPGLKTDVLPYLDFGGDERSTWTLEGNAGEEGRYSIVGRFGYTFDSRYQASFSFRQDVTSKFGPNLANKKGFFPAGNVYWRISEEEFVKNSLPWLTNLKLRASLGLTGNDRVSAYQYLNSAKLDGSGMYWGGSKDKGVEISSIANPSISWEKSRNYNLGLDLSLFSVFNLSANYWNKHTYDILGTQNNELPSTFGAKLADVNYGIVDSYGFDIEIGFNKQITKDVTVWARGNFAWADNKLVKYAEIGVPEHLSKIGKNYDRWAMYKSDGIVHDIRPQVDAQGTWVTMDYGDDRGAQKMYVVKTSTGNTYVVPQNYMIRDANQQINSPNYNSMRPGSVFFVDMDGDGHVHDEETGDKTWGINRFNPPYFYGLTLGGSWRGISLDVFVQGSAGNQNYVKYDNFASYEWTGASYAFWTGDMYSQLNPTGSMPMLVNTPSNSNNSTDFWTRDASFLRLKNVTLAYELPKSLLSKIRLSGAKVYASAQNLCFIYNSFKFFDPELTAHINTSSGQKDISNNPALDVTGSNGDGRIYNSGQTNYPLMRTFTFGVTLSF
jgi:TonB-linked SusC/RagA family outer membrane protein